MAIPPPGNCCLAISTGMVYPAMCPLRAPLGMVPTANWGRASRLGEPLRLGGDASPHPVSIADLLGMRDVRNIAERILGTGR